MDTTLSIADHSELLFSYAKDPKFQIDFVDIICHGLCCYLRYSNVAFTI